MTPGCILHWLSGQLITEATAGPVNPPAAPSPRAADSLSSLLSNKLPRCTSRPSLVSQRCLLTSVTRFRLQPQLPNPATHLRQSKASHSQCQSCRLLFTRRTPIGSATTPPPRLQRRLPARVRARRSSLTQCGHVCDGPLLLTTHSISPSMLGQSHPPRTTPSGGYSRAL